MDGVDDHRHCKVCGKPCALGSDVCSKACGRDFERRRQTRQQYTYLMYGLMAFLVLLLVLNYVRF